MPTFREVDVSAMQRVKQRTKGYQEREEYRQAILKLTLDKAIELVPGPGESARKIKLNLARASKEVSRAIKYGETGDGMIVASLLDEDAAPRKRRGRKAAEA